MRPKASPLLAGSFACVLLLVPLRADDRKPEAKLPPAVEGKIDFDRDVKPVRAAKCVKCHGPAKQKGGLRLDACSPAATPARRWWSAGAPRAG